MSDNDLDLVDFVLSMVQLPSCKEGSSEKAAYKAQAQARSAKSRNKRMEHVATQ